jgi:hypothetical protein
MKDKPKPEPAEEGAIEPWRCVSCGLFAYNLRWIDGDVYPTGGAPAPKYISIVYNRVCCICYDMFHALVSRDYWKHLQDEEKSKIRKLRPGSDYLIS